MQHILLLMLRVSGGKFNEIGTLCCQGFGFTLYLWSFVNSSLDEQIDVIVSYKVCLLVICIYIRENLELDSHWISTLRINSKVSQYDGVYSDIWDEMYDIV